jgi:hypothetical protein
MGASHETGILFATADGGAADAVGAYPHGGAVMVSKNLPKWMQHYNGDIHHPTPAEVEKDFHREAKAAQDAINGKPDSSDTRDMHAALMAHYGAMTLDGKPTGGRLTALGNALSRIDWQRVFIFTARTIAVVFFAFLTYQYSQYFAAFGISALAFTGQFAIGIFFLVAILQSTNGLQILTAAFGMYLLVNSF